MDMERVKKGWKKGLRKVFCLPPVPTLLISIPAYALVIYALAGEDVEPVITYVAYFSSAYALIITVTGITGVVRFAINLLYAGIKMFSGILYSSVWFVTLAVYYILLAIMRAALLHYVRKDGKSMVTEWRRYRLCGIILLFMNVALAGIIILVVHENSGFEYPGMLIYAMALYAFYATITAVRNVVRFRRYGSPVMSAAKVISLTAALVSMLSLETAMLTQFGAANDPAFRRTMTASTGAGISILVLGMALFMIVKATKHISHRKE